MWLPSWLLGWYCTRAFRGIKLASADTTSCPSKTIPSKMALVHEKSSYKSVPLSLHTRVIVSSSSSMYASINRFKVSSGTSSLWKKRKNVVTSVTQISWRVENTCRIVNQAPTVGSNKFLMDSTFKVKLRS